MSKHQAFFNQVAEDWDKKYNTLRLQAFLEQIVPSFGLSVGQSVLDVGTGTGILIPFLHKILGSRGYITAIDYAGNMVDICKSKHAHLSNVSVMVANLENLQFPEATFDAVTCFGLFPHLEKKMQALRQINRVLKPGGRLIIAHALSSEEIKTHHSNSQSVVAKDVLPQDSEMRQLLTKAGFRNISIVDKPGCYLCLSNKAKA